MVKLDCHFGQQQWLALKGHTHAGGLQHRQIICPIANGCRINRIDTILFAIMLKIGWLWRCDRELAFGPCPEFCYRAHAYDWRDGHENRKAQQLGR